MQNRTIQVSKGNKVRGNNVSILSKDKFFNNRLTYEITEDCIIFKVASLESYKAIEPHCVKNYYRFSITKDQIDIPFDYYKFDEDSSEDIVYIYYK
jgi:hypothetical protein